MSSFLELFDKMKKITFTFLTFFLVLGFSSGVEAQLVIDDFNSGTTTSQRGVGAASSAAAGLLGGERIQSLEVPSLSGDEFFGALGFTGGNLFLVQGSEDEVVGGLLYDSLNGIDLTGGGAYGGFRLDFTSVDSQISISDVLDLSVTSGDTTVSHNVTIPGQDSLGQVLVLFEDFEGVDFSSVDSVALDFDFTDNPGRDFQLGSFIAVAVPEPSSLSVLSLAVSAMFLRRRRR